MASLSSVISLIFDDKEDNSVIARCWDRLAAPTTATKYMEIPIGTDAFELPLLAFSGFRKMQAEKKEFDTIVARLYCCDQTSSYKSLDSVMKDVLSTHFDKHLSKVQVAGSTNVYYATFGAMLDKDFSPLMMLSWMMERKPDSNGVVKYHYVRPLMRISPHLFIDKEDALQRFLCGRMLTTALGTVLIQPHFNGCDTFISQSYSYSDRESYRVKVEIDRCPFTVRSTDIPSISTTNESLLQLAADHIDEILL